VSVEINHKDWKGPDSPVLERTLFIVWTPSSRGSRSRALAGQLGIDVHYVSATARSGVVAAMLKYPVQALMTSALLLRERPRVVLVQSPPSIAPLLVAVYAAITGARFVVDAHSDAMLSPLWTRPRLLYRHLARRALATIVTNGHFADTIRSWGGRALVLPDIPTSFPDGSFGVHGDFNVAVVNTFASDEPLDAILAAADDLEGVTFYVTGDTSHAPATVTSDVPRNVEFTGFLPEDRYYGLLRSSHAVMCLTTRDHTMQRGACEALSLGKPIITSDWPVLNDYFSMGTVHVDNTVAGIRAGVLQMRRGLDRYKEAIVKLQRRQQEEWESAEESLLQLINDSDNADTMRRGT
jgi:glycosyltransferase involved in cell wall biosynthesis